MATNNDMAVQSELEALRAENARLKEKSNKPLSFKVSEKKALSIYGMGRWPLSIYLQNFEKLVEALPRIQAFVEEHRSEFSTKE